MKGDRRAQDVTIISPVRRVWALWLRLSWPLANRSRLIKRDLVDLGFIQIAHWSLITRVPARARWGRAKRLPYPYLLFQSNFNDDLNAYVDAFAVVVPGRIQGMWGGAYPFPGTRPADAFVRFVAESTIESSYYYTGYPEGSSSMIKAALDLETKFTRFISKTEELSDRSFRKRFRKFLAKNQSLL